MNIKTFHSKWQKPLSFSCLFPKCLAHRCFSNLNGMIDIFKSNCPTKNLLARQIWIKEKNIFLKLLPLSLSLISLTLKQRVSEKEYKNKTITSRYGGPTLDTGDTTVEEAGRACGPVVSMPIIGLGSQQKVLVGWCPL